MVNDLRSLDDAIATKARRVHITVPPQNGGSQTFFENLYYLLERDRGSCSVVLDIPAGDTRTAVEANGLLIAGSRTLQRELEARGCSVDWAL